MGSIRSRKRIRKKADSLFPDDLIIDILSRLPAKSIIRCRLVSRRWRDLASTDYFKELHLRRRLPIIFVSDDTRKGFGHFLLDKWWEFAPEKLVFDEFVMEPQLRWPSYPNPYWAKFSHGGLVVLRDQDHDDDTPGSFLIINPINPSFKATVIIKLSEEFCCKGSDIYGVFFHPLVGEYCTLWRLYSRSQVYYRMLNLGSKPCWKDISNPWSHRIKIEKISPVLIGEHLYWMVWRDQDQEGSVFSGRADIMVFDIRREKFALMNCPVPSNLDSGPSCTGCQCNLSDIGGAVSFVLITQIKKYMSAVIKVDIWKLKDAAQQLWVSMNTCTIQVDDFLSIGRRNPFGTATALVGDTLILSTGKRFCLCNLKLGTSRTSLMPYNDAANFFDLEPGVSWTYFIPYNHRASFCHVMTLASLKNCKREITMDKDGEVVDELDMVLSLMA